MSSQPSEFAIDAPPEFSAKIASIFAQLKEIEKKRDETSQSRDTGFASSVQKEDPAVLRDDEFAIPRSRLQLDRRTNSLATSAPPASSSDLPRRRPPFEFRRPKVPPLPLPPRTTIPDHKLHPENWTKYSLASVEDGQLSDGANTAAALAYLKQQERRSQGQALWDEDAQLLDLRAKVVFHGNTKKRECRSLTLGPGRSNQQGCAGQPARTSPSEDEAGGEATHPSFGTKLRTLVESNANEHKRKQIALSHLHDVDDGEDADPDADGGSGSGAGHADVGGGSSSAGDGSNAMQVDQSPDTLRSESEADNAGSSADSERPEGLPRAKKIKRSIRSRAETPHVAEPAGAAHQDEPS